MLISCIAIKFAFLIPSSFRFQIIFLISHIWGINSKFQCYSINAYRVLQVRFSNNNYHPFYIHKNSKESSSILITFGFTSYPLQHDTTQSLNQLTKERSFRLTVICTILHHLHEFTLLPKNNQLPSNGPLIPAYNLKVIKLEVFFL